MRTDDIMGRAAELGLEVDNCEGHAEKVDGVTSPGEPAKKRSKLRSKFNQGERQAGRLTQRRRGTTG